MTTLKEPTQVATVAESYRATIRCKFLGNSGRISVSRYESNIHGQDPNRLLVAWDYSLNHGGNYRAAVAQYVAKANWGGVWVTSTITDGAVGVCIDAVKESK